MAIDVDDVSTITVFIVLSIFDSFYIAPNILILRTIDLSGFSMKKCPRSEKNLSKHLGKQQYIHLKDTWEME